MKQDLQNYPNETGQRRRGKHLVYDENPSLSGLFPTRIASRKPKEMDHAYMVSPGTGTILAKGTFGFIEEKEVDSEQFVKVYLEGIRQYGQLSKSGVHLFELVYREMSGHAAKDKDRVVLNHHIALKWNPNLPRSTFYRGLSELLDKGFLFRSQGADVYYVNICFMFKGDCLALVRSFRRVVVRNDETA